MKDRKFSERLRWLVATLLDKLPGQCWADLCGWVLHDRRDDPGYRGATPWSPIRSGCREDFARVGSCYCGKLREKPASTEVAR